MTQQKLPLTSGHIPESGFITAAELAKRLHLKNVPNLQDELEKLGIEYRSICGKRVYPCDSLKKMFWE